MNDDGAPFSVYQDIKGGTTECVGVYDNPEDAVGQAHSYCTRPAARLGIIERVIITDNGDCIVFEWLYGHGVTFPPRDRKTGKFVADDDASD